MRSYLLLDIATITLAILGILAFYSDFMNGNFNIFLILYFLLLSIGYFITMNKINNHSKNIMKKLAAELNCVFVDGGKYSLTHFIKCKDMEIKINLRGSYTPSSLHLIFYGNFNEADMKLYNQPSQNFIKMIKSFQLKYNVKVNDAYISRNRAEAIITRFPYDHQKLKEIIKEYKKIVLKV